MLIDLVEPKQTGAAAAPALAAIQAPAPPTAMQAGAHSSSPSSEAMRGLGRGPPHTAAMHQNVEYEDVHGDEDDLHVLVNDINKHASGKVRVRNVNDVNDLHAINKIGTNDVFLNVNDGMDDNLNRCACEYC